MKVVSREKLMEHQRILSFFRNTHTVEFSGSGMTLKYGKKTMYAPQNFEEFDKESFYEFLGLASMVRSDLKKSNLIFDKKRVSFHRLQQIEDCKQAFEIDMKHAYWNLAKKVGIISDKTYRKGEKVSKINRLRGLGSIASRREVFKMDKDTGEMVFSHVKENEQGRNAFFYLSWLVEKTMLGLFDTLPGGMLGYWFDAAFLRSGYESQAIEYFNGLGFEVKTLPVSIENYAYDVGKRYIQVIEKNPTVIDQGEAEHCKYRVKRFSFHMDNTKKGII
jgi:hypothetical protein